MAGGTDVDDDIPVGRGGQLARWTIDAMQGTPSTVDGLDDDAARQLRRVNAAVAALQGALDASEVPDDADAVEPGAR